MVIHLFYNLDLQLHILRLEDLHKIKQLNMKIIQTNRQYISQVAHQ